jgi:hypothetical protein
VILLNQVVQVFIGPDERLSRQDTIGLQFGDGLMGRLTTVECDLLRGLMTADRLLEEAYGGRFTNTTSIFPDLARRIIRSRPARSFFLPLSALRSRRRSVSRGAARFAAAPRVALGSSVDLGSKSWRRVRLSLFDLLAGKVFKYAVVICDGYFIARFDVTAAGKIGATPFDDMWSEITILSSNLSKLPTIIIIENCDQFHNLDSPLQFLFSVGRFFNNLRTHFITFRKLEFLRLRHPQTRKPDAARSPGFRVL